MFSARNKTTNKLLNAPILGDNIVEEELRNLSDNKLIICDECEHQVVFRNSSAKLKHFFHQTENPNCNYSPEPESKEHISGKILLFNRLKELYPSSSIFLEYKIKETNQRADIAVRHPDGKMWVFEFQCSRINGEEWKRRHELYLYKEAGVEKAFWFLSNSMSPFWTKSQKARQQAKLNSICSTIYHYKECKRIVFLNVNENTIHLLHNGDLHENKIIYSIQEVIDIGDFTIINKSIYFPKYSLIKDWVNDCLEGWDKQQREKILSTSAMPKVRKLRDVRLKNAILYIPHSCPRCFGRLKVGKREMEDFLLDVVGIHHAAMSHHLESITRSHVPNVDII